MSISRTTALTMKELLTTGINVLPCMYCPCAIWYLKTDIILQVHIRLVFIKDVPALSYIHCVGEKIYIMRGDILNSLLKCRLSARGHSTPVQKVCGDIVH